ncbi:MAG: nucleoside/nucleotide kinase family protein [Propionibacterium sp.]|nr:nucleoside/nucleotide kinase family protein [Propionibacterium sp.]
MSGAAEAPAAAAERIAAAATTRRVIIGIAGPPGSGKSTVAELLVDALRARGVRAVAVPMDGFHLSDAVLEHLGRMGRKGAPETFDVDGYVELLRRIRSGSARTIYAPGFERTLEQPIAAAIAVEPEAEVIVTEGNYLLLDDGGWREVAAELDECWYVDTADAPRRERLRRRHEEFGKSPEEAAGWVDDVDEPNADLVRSTRHRATHHIEN